MECRIHLDVDCTYVEREDVTRAEGELRKIVEFLKADSGQLQPSQVEDSVYPSHDKKLVDIAFCNLIDRSVETNQTIILMSHTTARLRSTPRT